MKKAIFVVGIIFIALGLGTFAAAYVYGNEVGIMEENTIEFVKNFDDSAINKLEITENYYNIKIQKGSYLGVYCERIKENTLVAEQKDDGTLVIRSESDGNNQIKIGIFNLPNFFAKKQSWEKYVIYVYIPDDKVFESVNISGNVGNINIESIKSNALSIIKNVGNCTADGIHADSLTMGDGVGNIKIGGTVKNSTDIHGGVGNCSFKGTISGDIKVDAGVGNISLTLSNDADYYNYSVKSGVGAVKLDGKKIADMFSDDSQLNNGNESSPSFSINGGVGNIDIITGVSE